MDDGELGMEHLTGWERVSMVSDHPLINTFTKFFGYLFSFKVRLFKNDAFEEAKKWIGEKWPARVGYRF